MTCVELPRGRRASQVRSTSLYAARSVDLCRFIGSTRLPSSFADAGLLDPFVRDPGVGSGASTPTTSADSGQSELLPAGLGSGYACPAPSRVMSDYAIPSTVVSDPRRRVAVSLAAAASRQVADSAKPIATIG